MTKAAADNINSLKLKLWVFQSNFRIQGHGGTLYFVLQLLPVSTSCYNCYQSLPVATIATGCIQLRWIQAVAVAFPSVAAGCHWMQYLFCFYQFIIPKGFHPLEPPLIIPKGFHPLEPPLIMNNRLLLW